MHWVLETTKCTALPTPSHEPATCGPEIWSHSSPERPSHLNTVTNNRNGIVIGTIIPPTSSECESHLLCVVSPVPVRLIPLAWPWLGCTGDHYHVLPGTSTSQWHRPANQKPASDQIDQSESTPGVQDGDTGTGITSYHPASPCFTDCLPLQRGMISANQSPPWLSNVNPNESLRAHTSVPLL